MAAETWQMGTDQLDAVLQGVRETASQCAIQLGVAVNSVSTYVEILELAHKELARLVQDGIEAGDASVQRLSSEWEALSNRVERLEAMSYRDELTGAYNLRACRLFTERFTLEARNTTSPLGVVSFDIDDFKGVNARLGRSKASTVLRKLVTLVGGTLRGDAILAVAGGRIRLPGRLIRGEAAHRPAT